MPTVYYKVEGESIQYKRRAKCIMINGIEVKLSLDPKCEEELPDTQCVTYEADNVATVGPDDSDKSSLAGCQLYRPVHPREISLGSCENDNIQHCLAFTAKLALPFDFASMSGLGHSVQSDVIHAYHDHFLWGYALRLSREEGDLFSLSMESLGPSVGTRGRLGFSDFTFPELSEPRLIEADLFLLQQEKEEEKRYLDLLYTRKGVFSVEEKFTQEELRRLADISGTLHFSLRLVIARSDFSLSSIIDLNHQSTVSESAQSIVEEILRGEKPRGTYLMITSGYTNCKCFDSSAPFYYVHKSAFANSQVSHLFEGWTKRKDPAKVHGLCDGALRLAIYAAYGVDAPLPDKRCNQRRVISTVASVFVHLHNQLLLHWERLICRMALAMDRHHPSSSMVELFHCFDIIWSFSAEGGFPVAKRVVIGVLADMAHLNARFSLQQWVIEEVLPHLEESECEPENVCGVLTAFHKLMNAVPKVEKKIVPLVVVNWND